MRQGCHALAAPLVTGQEHFGCSIQHQETPTSLIPNPRAGEKKKKKSMLLSTWPSLQERVERGHVSPNSGAPLNTCEWPQLYLGPSQSQQSVENQNNIKIGFSQLKNSGLYEHNVFLVKFLFFLRNVVCLKCFS